MADPTHNRDQLTGDAVIKKRSGKMTRLNARSSLTTLVLTAVIIVGGFMLPAMLYPFLDAYSGRLIQLASPTDDMVSGHVFEEQVTFYPWNLLEESQLRYLASHEMVTLEQSGVADLLVSMMLLSEMPVEDNREEYLQMILGSFRCLEPDDFAEPGCFVLVDEDLGFTDELEVRCAVDFSGNIISLLFISEDWSSLELTEPIRTSVVEAGETTPMPARPTTSLKTVLLTPRAILLMMRGRPRVLLPLMAPPSYLTAFRLLLSFRWITCLLKKTRTSGSFLMCSLARRLKLSKPASTLCSGSWTCSMRSALVIPLSV